MSRLKYFELPGVEAEPLVKMRYWRLMQWTFPENLSNGETVVFIYGAEDDGWNGMARKSTPIVSIEKHEGSDFEWLATTESGRKYILHRQGGDGENRDMNQLECDLYDDADRNNIELKLLTVQEWLKNNDLH